MQKQHQIKYVTGLLAVFAVFVFLMEFGAPAVATSSKLSGSAVVAIDQDKDAVQFVPDLQALRSHVAARAQEYIEKNNGSAPPARWYPNGDPWRNLKADEVNAVFADQDEPAKEPAKEPVKQTETPPVQPVAYQPVLVQDCPGGVCQIPQAVVRGAVQTTKRVATLPAKTVRVFRSADGEDFILPEDEPVETSCSGSSSSYGCSGSQSRPVRRGLFGRILRR